ncbi:hypothetical protein PBY51_006381 [Eleginops maclovinus]|uniref:Uncharacterized protein n=1 Tax=Eleginops maclovinus TaxID=56733 RepID=A0AAN7WVR3_ELEMC|nr:hypothetical protein PBY51_006381 [Eleginops maclovinus]
MGAGLQLQPASTQVTLIENGPEENPLHYRWPESRPTITQTLPCFPNKEQSTSRTFLISPQNLSSYWSAADVSNCTDIDTIEVSCSVQLGVQREGNPTSYSCQALLLYYYISNQSVGGGGAV